MVTISMIVFLFLSILLLSIIDTFYYPVSLLEAAIYLMYPESATRKSIALCALLAGFLYAIIVDYRHLKNKQKSSKQS